MGRSPEHSGQSAPSTVKTSLLYDGYFFGGGDAPEPAIVTSQSSDEHFRPRPGDVSVNRQGQFVAWATTYGRPIT
jgi:hypothetical protein